VLPIGNSGNRKGPPHYADDDPSNDDPYLVYRLITAYGRCIFLTAPKPGVGTPNLERRYNRGHQKDLVLTQVQDHDKPSRVTETEGQRILSSTSEQ